MAESNIAYAVFIIVLLIALALAIAWGVYGYQQLASRSVEFVESPYCVRTVCGTPGSEPVPITLAPSDDPQRTSYQTIAWCVTNAPPTGFTQKLADGALLPADNAIYMTGGEFATPEFNELILGFSIFYVGNTGTLGPGSYTYSCGYAWSNAPFSFEQVPEADPLTNASLYGGINDQVWIDCVDVMGKMVSAGSVGAFETQYNTMKSLCGAACDVVSIPG